MSPVKDFTLTYETLNEEGTFSEGDTLAGTLSFTLTKDTKVKSIFVKAKGEAHVHWSEGSGDSEKSYSAHRRYFKLKEVLFEENAKGISLSQGIHRFKFRFQIPECEMPPSFKGPHGKIVYKLEAKLSRNWRWPSGTEKEIIFVSKSFPQIEKMMCPQSGSVNKEMGVFSKGQVQMSATVNRKICSPGDTLSVVATICNSSSKTMRPKFHLQQKTVYSASSSTNTSYQSLCKIVGDTIAPNAEETVSCQLQVPVDTICSLYNCEIISVEYCLKVYLDISFAIDPEVVFPLTIIPSSLTGFQANEPLGPYPAGATGGPSYSDFPPSAFPVAPFPVHTGPGAYGYPPPYPPQQMDYSAYNNQRPQQAAPFGFQSAALASSPSQHPAAPPPFQQGEEPPSYMSLFPDDLRSGTSARRS